MRMTILAASLALLAPLAQAQTAPAVPPTNVPSAAAPSNGAAPRARQTLEQRFQGANRSNDGHLTLDQASGARWFYVTRNFDAMDKAHRGYLTVEDIRGYARERRAARQQQQRTGSTSNG